MITHRLLIDVIHTTGTTSSQGLLVFQHEEKRLRSAGEIVSGFMTLLLSWLSQDFY